jgi:hypothetical protein
MAETVSWKRNRIGRGVHMVGTFISSGTTVDINTGMRRVRWATLQGQTTDNNECGLSRNAVANTDGGTAYGTLHFENVTAARVYNVIVMGR